VGTGSSFCPMGEPTGTDLLSSIAPLFPMYSEISASRLLCLPSAFKLVPCLAYSSTLKMEATCSSEILVGFQRTTQHYIPVGRTLRSKLLLTVTSVSFMPRKVVVIYTLPQLELHVCENVRRCRNVNISRFVSNPLLF
jgi:hypothetical protein